VTSDGAALPVARLAVIFVLCLVVGGVVALAVAFLLYPVIPFKLHRDSGGLFFLLAVVIAFAFYSRLKAWIISRNQDGT
jgi:hypothetical protein